MTQAMENDHTLRTLIAKAAGDVPTYFRGLGFEVSWDFSKHSGLHWYEIYEGDELLVQVDFNAPLAEIKTEFPRLAALEEGDDGRDGATTWEVRGPIKDLRRVVARMLEEVVP